MKKHVPPGCSGYFLGMTFPSQLRGDEFHKPCNHKDPLEHMTFLSPMTTSTRDFHDIPFNNKRGI